ncbi:MAG: hypothetical protein ACK4M7_05450 [Burkholderiales bacterium]
MRNKKLVLMMVLGSLFTWIGCTCGNHASTSTTSSSQSSTSISSTSHTSNHNNQENSSITKLTYTINLSQQDNQGNHLAKLGELIIIQAQAAGPHQNEAKWLVDKTFQGLNIEFDGDLQQTQQPYQKNITEEFKFNTKGSAFPTSGIIKLVCHPVLEKVNGLNLYEAPKNLT